MIAADDQGESGGRMTLVVRRAKVTADMVERYVGLGKDMELDVCSPPGFAALTSPARYWGAGRVVCPDGRPDASVCKVVTRRFQRMGFNGAHITTVVRACVSLAGHRHVTT